MVGRCLKTGIERKRAMTNETAREIIESLLNGIDPLTGELLNNKNTFNVLNSNEVKFALNYAIGAIDTRNNYKELKPEKKRPAFSLSEEEKNRIVLEPDSWLTVSEIAKRINVVINDNRMKMDSSAINRWLCKKDIIVNNYYNERNHYKLTEYGHQLGCKSTLNTGKKDGFKYWKLTYPIEVQRAIINNAEEIMAAPKIPH